MTFISSLVSSKQLATWLTTLYISSHCVLEELWVNEESLFWVLARFGQT